jgi:hypothetical protein
MTQPIDTSDEKMRPIAVHVQKIAYDVTLTHIYRKRVAVIDLELTHKHVEDLLKNLQERLKNERGAIRVRFEGLMVLE